ncbi:MAG: hypothetical protein AB1Z98_08070, partial [Nannocystaceae bacterium]
DDGWGPIAWTLFIGFLLWLAEQELSLSIDIDRALWSFDETDSEDGRFDPWNKTICSELGRRDADRGVQSHRRRWRRVHRDLRGLALGGHARGPRGGRLRGA